MNINSIEKYMKNQNKLLQQFIKKIIPLPFSRGYVEAGRREGLCQVTCLEKGIRMLKASYYNDRLGKISCQCVNI